MTAEDRRTVGHMLWLQSTFRRMQCLQRTVGHMQCSDCRGLSDRCSAVTAEDCRTDAVQ
jgi:hypothetical protein